MRKGGSYTKKDEKAKPVLVERTKGIDEQQAEQRKKQEQVDEPKV